MFDPSKITYAELLDIFWSSHSPTSKAFSNQYKSIIFYHDEEQRQLAEDTKKDLTDRLVKPILTEFVPASDFYLAETYHQKYQLQQNLSLMELLAPQFETNEAFIDSTLTARLNGYLGGHLSLTQLEEEMVRLDVAPELVEQILGILHP